MGISRTMGCGASTGTTQPPPSPTALPKTDVDSVVEKHAESSPVQNVEAKVISAPAADEGPLPGGIIPDACDDIEPFREPMSPSSPAPAPPVVEPVSAPTQPRSESALSAGLKERPGSAGAARPSSAGKQRPSTPTLSKEGSKERPGSAGRNRGEQVKPSVWLTDKLDRQAVKDAEARVDKDIFRNGSPSKKKKSTRVEKSEKRKVVQED